METNIKAGRNQPFFEFLDVFIQLQQLATQHTACGGCEKQALSETTQVG